MKSFLILCAAVMLVSTAGAAERAPMPKPRPVIVAANVATPRPRPAAAPSTGAKITTTQAQSNPLTVLQSFTVVDLQAALADAQAQTPPDVVAGNCYSALIPLVQNATGVSGLLPSGPGGFQLLQKARDLKAILANIQSPTGPLQQLNIACAPLVLDVQNTLVQLGIVGGTVAATSGLTLPIALPFTLPGL